MLKLPVSIGEGLDKLSILEIKRERIRIINDWMAAEWLDRDEAESPNVTRLPKRVVWETLSEHCPNT